MSHSRQLDLAVEKGSSAWPSVLPVLFCDAVKLRYDLAVGDIPSNCVFGELFNVSQSMIYKEGDFAIQRDKRSLEAKPLTTVCSDVETEPVLRKIYGEQLSRGNKYNAKHNSCEIGVSMQTGPGSPNDRDCLEA